MNTLEQFVKKTKILYKFSREATEMFGLCAQKRTSKFDDYFLKF